MLKTEAFIADFGLIYLFIEDSAVSRSRTFRNLRSDGRFIDTEGNDIAISMEDGRYGTFLCYYLRLSLRILVGISSFSFA